MKISEFKKTSQIETMQNRPAYTIYKSYQQRWEENQADPERDDITYHISEQEAIEVSKKISLEIGFTPYVDVVKIYQDDADKYFLELEEQEIDEIEIEDLLDIYHDTEYVCSGDVNEGESIEGSILVYWNWEKYVGYARNLESIDYAPYQMTEKDLHPGNEDSRFKTNVSVLVDADELLDLTDCEKIELIQEKLESGTWKWNYFRNNPESINIAKSLGLSCNEEE
jgi:hypothetical protein